MRVRAALGADAAPRHESDVDFVGAMEIGLRFLRFCHYGRPFGDDRRIADEFIAAAMQIQQERISRALGAEPKATFRWIVEIGRALREHTLDFD